MAISLVAHIAAAGDPAAIDTTGSNLIIVYVDADNSPTPAITDSKSNSWTALPVHAATHPNANLIFYSLNPTVGTGHTFSVTGVGAASIFVSAYAGVLAYVSDDGAGTTVSTSSIQPGAITPTNGTLLVTGLGYFALTATASIDSGFTITDQVASVAGTNYGGAMGYKVVSSIVPVNPTWTITVASATGACCSMVAFSPITAGSGLGRITQSALETLTLQPGLAFITQSVIETLVGLGINCGSPPNGFLGLPYSHMFPSGGGTAPVTFAITAGALPGGLSLNSSTGLVSGMPSAVGTFTFTISVTDAMLSVASVICTIQIMGSVSLALYGWKLYPELACEDAIEGVELPSVDRAV